MTSATFTERLLSLEQATRNLAEFQFDTESIEDLLNAKGHADVVAALNGIPTGSSQALAEFLEAARPDLVLELLERSRSAGRVRVETGDRAIEVPVASTAGQSILADFLDAEGGPSSTKRIADALLPTALELRARANAAIGTEHHDLGPKAAEDLALIAERLVTELVELLELRPGPAGLADQVAEVEDQVDEAAELDESFADPVEVSGAVIAHAGRSLLASVGVDHLAMVTEVLGELCDEAEPGDQVRRGLVALDAVLAPLVPPSARLREYTRRELGAASAASSVGRSVFTLPTPTPPRPIPAAAALPIDGGSSGVLTADGERPPLTWDLVRNLCNNAYREGRKIGLEAEEVVIMKGAAVGPTESGPIDFSKIPKRDELAELVAEVLEGGPILDELRESWPGIPWHHRPGDFEAEGGSPEAAGGIGDSGVGVHLVIWGDGSGRDGSRAGGRLMVRGRMLASDLELEAHAATTAEVGGDLARGAQAVAIALDLALGNLDDRS